jgi:TPR repeat protein
VPAGTPSVKAAPLPDPRQGDTSMPDYSRCPANEAVCLSECDNDGKAASCYALGAIAEGGSPRGAPPNYVEALRNYKQVCAGGDSQGCAAAARIDAAKPSNAPWQHYQFEKIKEQCAGARINGCQALGSFYESGIFGAPKSPSLALAAYQHGCDAGDTGSCMSFKSLQQRMPVAP